MFISKINGVSNLGFKGIQHVKNDVGQTLTRFYYPFDSEKETCEIQIYKATPNEKYNYNIEEKPIYTFTLGQDGVDIDIQKMTELDKDAPFAYKYVRRDKLTGKILSEGADTGVKLKKLDDGSYGFRVDNDKKWKEKQLDNKKSVWYESNDYNDSISNYAYTLVSRKGTTPIVQGAGYLITPDAYMPGASYDKKTGKIIYDEAKQREMENLTKNFSNIHGGSMAGMEMKVPELRKNGIKILFSTPIANGSEGWSLGYWNKNNMQISPNMGTMENFNSFFRELYKNGMKYVFDGTFTSEGLEGIQFNYALRWADRKPQSYYWFRMNGIDSSNLGLGVVPKNKENLRHKLINPPYNYELQSDGTYKKVANPNYDKNKETLFQIYDAKQVSENLANDTQKQIKVYDKHDYNELEINSHDDTIINFAHRINPLEYDNRIKVINQLNKDGKEIRLDTALGTMVAGQFSNFKINTKTEGGMVNWDANTDMVKKNYQISGYDETILQSITDLDKREYERQRIIRGTKEVQDMAMQAGKYWSGKVKDIQTMYIAQTIGSSKTIEAIDKLIEEGKLPQEAKLNSQTLNNILNGYYLLEPVGTMERDDVTVKALMKAPLDTLEFGEDTVGVLATSFFSNRATTDETIGMTRFELMKQGNPHLVEPYSEVYTKMNKLFDNEIKNFTDSILEKINENSNEKLIDQNGKYTEYGEYVIRLVGQDILKYAMFKALAGEKLQTWALDNGEITYDYEDLKNNTTLMALGINAESPEQEAKILANKFAKGLAGLGESDIAYVADSISKRIAGTDTMSFRLAEALAEPSGLGLDWRLDAMKDVMDMDAIRNEENDFDDTWNEVIGFWDKFVQTIKTENKHSSIVAEITDIPDLMRDTYGLDSSPYNSGTDIGGRFNGEPDALAKLFNETGITTEAAYSYFFTDMLKVFSPEFESGQGISENHDSFKGRMDLLMQTRSADYLRNLYTFMGNHDKPRLIHGLAVDMRLYHSKLLHDYKDFTQEHDQRMDTIRVLSGAKSMKDVPIELRLNVDNNDYFKTISPRAVAQSKMILDVVNEDLDGIASKEQISQLNKALVDLTNGNFLGIGETENLTKINIKELSNLDNAFETILNMAKGYGLSLSETEKAKLKSKVIEIANNKDLSDYLVHGDFSWEVLNEDIRKQNNKYASEILNSNGDYSKYSLYTVQLARLLKDSYKESGLNSNFETVLNTAFRDFVIKYNQDTINGAKSQFKTEESYKKAMVKNGYAARDIEKAIQMAVKQAEYNSGREFENKEAIIDAIRNSILEPAVAKGAMAMGYLGGMFGVPTMYAGDEYGMGGMEEKAKNIYLQNRNVIPETQKEKRSKFIETMNGSIAVKDNPELSALSNGTPYNMDVMVNSRTREDVYARIDEINKDIEELGKIKSPDNLERIEALSNERRELTKELAKIAYMMYSGDGSATVSVFYAGDIEHKNRVDYFEKYGLKTEEDRKKFFEENNIDSINPNNKYVPIQKKTDMDAILLGAGIALPVGTVFLNSSAKDKAEYIVQKIGDKLGIVRKDGGKIILDGATSKNGVMILKTLKKVAFRGKNSKPFFNKQYNFASNVYNQVEIPEEGQKLSLISR